MCVLNTIHTLYKIIRNNENSKLIIYRREVKQMLCEWNEAEVEEKRSQTKGYLLIIVESSGSIKSVIIVYFNPFDYFFLLNFWPHKSQRMYRHKRELE